MKKNPKPFPTLILVNALQQTLTAFLSYRVKTFPAALAMKIALL